MNTGRVGCPNCKGAVPAEAMNGQEWSACARCETLLQVFAFPALYYVPPPVAVADAGAADGHSSCFYHPHKRAVIACESCGRFLCALCDVEIGAVHRCPRCLEAGRRKKNVDELQTRSVRYDRIALALAVFPILFWPITFVSAPAALVLVVKYWNRRSKILPAGRFNYIVAGLLALLQIFGWLWLVYALVILKHW